MSSFHLHQTACPRWVPRCEHQIAQAHRCVTRHGIASLYDSRLVQREHRAAPVIFWSAYQLPSKLTYTAFESKIHELQTRTRDMCLN